MTRFPMTIILTCLLAGSAMGGEVPSGGFAPPPPPPPTTGAATTPALGDVPTGGSAQQTVVDEVIQGVLNFLGGLVP